MTAAEPKGLREIRGDRAMSIRGLAAAAGVTAKTVQRIESGQPMRAPTIARIARALDVEPMGIQEYADQRRREKQTTAQDGS